jgi:multiple sugar transport system permease protein
VGLQNFRDLATDPIFRTALWNNVVWVLGFGGLSVVGGSSSRSP